MIESALRTALISDAELAEDVGKRVYPGTAPDDATRPYIVYRVVSQTCGNAESEETCRFDVEVFAINETQSPGYASAVKIAKAVKRVSQSMLGEHDGVCIYSSSKPEIRDTLFRATNQHGRLIGLFFRYTEED